MTRDGGQQKVEDMQVSNKSKMGDEVGMPKEIVLFRFKKYVQPILLYM